MGSVRLCGWWKPNLAWVRSVRYLSSATLLGLCAVLALFPSPLYAATATLYGRVVDEHEAPVHAALVAVRAAGAAATGSPANSWGAQTDPTGAFTVDLPAAGDYLVSVEREGYYALKDRKVHVEGAQELTLVINIVREVFQSDKRERRNLAGRGSPDAKPGTPQRHGSKRYAVREQPQPAEFDAAHAGRGSRAFRRSARERILRKPSALSPRRFRYHRPDFRQIFRRFSRSKGFAPSIFPRAAIRRSSERARQACWPSTPTNGTDKFHYTATDFFPGLSFQQGLHLGNWYPRRRRLGTNRHADAPGSPIRSIRNTVKRW